MYSTNWNTQVRTIKEECGKLEGGREQRKERSSGKGIIVEQGGEWTCERRGERKADLGAWELQSTCDIFLKQPFVKGLTPPRNFPVTYRERVEDRKTLWYQQNKKKGKKSFWMNSEMLDVINKTSYVPVHLWSYHEPLTLCGTQSGQRLGQKTDQQRTLQPYWEEVVKKITSNTGKNWNKKRKQREARLHYHINWIRKSNNLYYISVTVVSQVKDT